MQLIGVISDTHGLVRPDALEALAGAALIIHAGDIGQPQVLDALRAVAPVSAIRGNIDRGPWAEGLPETLDLRFGRVSIHVLHDLKRLDRDPGAVGIDVVVAGHSHRPKIHREGGVLYLNPGSAGPRRFRLPVALALLTLSPAGIDAEHVVLE